MSNPSFDQAYQVLNLVRESGASLENLQAIYMTGFLSDLLKAKNLAKVDREAFRKLLGYDSSVFKVKMGGANNTDQIMAALPREFWFDEWITQANFPLVPSTSPWEDEVEVFDPKCEFNAAEGLKLIFDRGLMPPTCEHWIRFAEQQGMATTSHEKPFIEFLCDGRDPADPDYRMMWIVRGLGHREIHSNYAVRRAGASSVLAGVRRHK